MAKTKTTAKKTASKTKAKPKPKNTRNILGKKTDLAKVEPCNIDFCNIKLNQRQHNFLSYYLNPADPCFHNAMQAAKKAGYSADSANTNIYRFLREPDVQRIIKANEGLAQQALLEAAKKAIGIKKQRAFFNPADYFEQKEVELETKNGTITKQVVELKPMEEMTEMQLMAVDGIDLKSTYGMPVYVLPDRKKELDDIIKMSKEYGGGIGDGQDVEELREVIIERVTLRQTKRGSLSSEVITRVLDRADGIGEEEP